MRPAIVTTRSVTHQFAAPRYLSTQVHCTLHITDTLFLLILMSWASSVRLSGEAPCLVTQVCPHKCTARYTHITDTPFFLPTLMCWASSVRLSGEAPCLVTQVFVSTLYTHH